MFKFIKKFIESFYSQGIIYFAAPEFYFWCGALLSRVLSIFKKIGVGKLKPPKLQRRYAYGHYPTITSQLPVILYILKENVENILFVKYYLLMVNFTKVIMVLNINLQNVVKLRAKLNTTDSFSKYSYVQLSALSHCASY